MAFLSREYEEAVAALAQRNIFVGTSSWKYPGWIGQLYDEQRYLWRGKVSNARFERECLEEYGRVFKSVCVDAGYYRFPTEETLPKLVAQVPDETDTTDLADLTPDTPLTAGAETALALLKDDG